MKKFILTAIFIGLIPGASLAQSIWNPNSPRSRQLVQSNPALAQRAPAPAQQNPITGTTPVPGQWGTYGSPAGSPISSNMSQPTWGTVGGNGWGSH